MRYYPIFVNLGDKDCLVVGAGGVGRRKVRSLLESNPRSVQVIEIQPPSEDFSDLLENPRLNYTVKDFEEQDLKDKFLVIASTSNRALNQKIAALCEEHGILCNVADQPEKCSFTVPAVFTQGDLTVAVSTGGASPALSKRIRKDLEEHFGPHYAAFVLLMSRVRPMVLALDAPTEENTRIFRSLVSSDILDALKDKDVQRTEAIMGKHLPKELHSQIKELTDGLF